MLTISLLILAFKSVAHDFSIAVNERDIYRYVDDKGQWQGKDIELIDAVFRRMPHNYQITAMPWPRVLESIKQGTVDMTLAATILPERRQYAYFSKQAFRFSHYILFVNRSKLTLFESATNLRDLMHRKVLIGALRGAIYSSKYNQLLQDRHFYEKIVYIGDDQSMVAFALKERVDGYIDSEIEGKHYLNKQPEFKDYIVPLFRITNDEEAQSGLMFSKKTVTQEEVAEFDVALQALHDSGEYAQISAKFNPVSEFQNSQK